LELLKKNLELLRVSQPSLAVRVEREPKQSIVRVLLAKDGSPIPQVGSVSLHSNYYPLKEATDGVSDYVLNDNEMPVIYGLGFGYHVLEILKRCQNSEVLVIEPMMSVFQAFLESVDLEPFIPNTKFCISTPSPKIVSSNQIDNWNKYEHQPSKRLSNDYFRRLDKAIETSIYLNVNRLKILVINPYYGGSLPTAKYCKQALNDIGHDVESVECDKFAEGFFSIKNTTRNKVNEEALSNQFSHFMGQLIAAKAADYKPDLILALAQAPMTPETIKNLKLLNIPIAFWFVEDFRTLSYWKEIVSCYDYFFTIQRGDFFKELSSLGKNNFYYLPQGCYPEVHKEINLSQTDIDQYTADLSFMGSGYYNRVQSFPRLLNYDFKIWGTEWSLGSHIGSRVQNNNKRIESNEIVKIYNAGKINLNLHSSTFHNSVNPVGDFVNPRTFEIAACGGFQLVDERSELAELMELGSEVVTFNTIDDLCKKIDHYLEHEDEAKLITAKGKERVLKEHTIQHRMHEMLTHVFMDNLNSLKERMNSRYRDPVSYYIDHVGDSSSLGKYLDQYRGLTNFSIKTMVDNIANGEGRLSHEELLVLMTDQIVKSKVPL
jgi:spore maturation protein CgeB